MTGGDGVVIMVVVFSFLFSMLCYGCQSRVVVVVGGGGGGGCGYG